MTVDVVVSVGDLDSLVLLACVQRTFGGIPVHIWVPGRRSAPVACVEKHLLQEHLRERERKWGPAPLLFPAQDLLHEAHTLDQVVGRMLREHPGRRYFACRAGTFMGHRVDAVDPVRTVPFPGVWFLVARGRGLEGRGTFRDLLVRGHVVARYAPFLAPNTSARADSVVSDHRGARHAGVGFATDPDSAAEADALPAHSHGGEAT